MPLLRISCPSEHTTHVVEVLGVEAAATEITVIPGASRVFPGDVVVAEVPRSSIDALVVLLAEGGVPHVHHLSLQPSERLVPEDHADADDDAVIWAQVVQDVHEAGRLSWINLLLIVVAAGIAAVGIIQDQLLLIVGAMALSPDYFPIVDTCLAVVRRAWGRAREALVTLVVSFSCAAVGAGLLTEALSTLDLVDLGAPVTRQLTLFISHPDALSVVVALLAGVAGALALTLPDARGLVGVFVSITTIPAAANIGVAVATRDWGEAGGALLMLLVNVVSLLVAGVVTLELRRRYGDVPPKVRAFRPAGRPLRR